MVPIGKVLTVYLANGTRKLTLKKSEVGRLPKKSYVDLAITLDGAPYVARVTSNLAWCGKGEKALEYIWVEVDGIARYVTLNPGERAVSFAGTNFVPTDGAGDPVPKRVTATPTAKKREENRVNDFRKTWAEKYGPKVAEPTGDETPAAEPTGETEGAE